MVLEAPLVAFFDRKEVASARPDATEIADSPVAFRILVDYGPLRDGSWPVIGAALVPEELASPPWFFKQDPIDGRVYITKTGAEDIPATAAEADKLERAAVWGIKDVSDRLRDHLAGRGRKWLESDRVDRKKIPTD